MYKDAITLLVRRLNPPFQLVGNGEANNKVEISDKLWTMSYVKSYSYLMIGEFIFKAERVSSVNEDEIFLNYFHRKLLNVTPGDHITVRPCEFNTNDFKISKIAFDIDLLRVRPNNANLTEIIDNYRLIHRFKQEFREHVLKCGQKVTMDFEGDSLVLTCLSLDPPKIYGIIDDNVSITIRLKPTVESLKTTDETIRPSVEINKSNLSKSYYRPSPNLMPPLKREPVKRLATIVRRPRRRYYDATYDGSQDIIKSNTNLWNKTINLDELGIGGLDHQFKELFRRAFISRVYPPEIIKQCGIKHVKGVILYGPPGTGKTLLARKIGEILECKNVKVVNGPELLNRFVGQSEENVRNLFAEAEQEYSEKGDQSSLHLIILDEMDALCKARGTHTSVAVHDSIVNQLLTKMDGINSLHNVLIIGMTNRLDLLDVALLRPGRFELQLEINLPDKDGRLKILQIHTRSLKENGLLESTLDLDVYARMTINFTGAELEAMVKSAIAFSLTRFRDHNHLDNALEARAVTTLQVNRSDFESAFKEIKPSFGYQSTPEDLKALYAPYGLVNYNRDFYQLSLSLNQWIMQTKAMKSRKSTLLLMGKRSSGATALATMTGLELQSPFFRLITQEALVGLSELEKCRYLESVFRDAEKSESSTIILDSLERLIGYCEIGNRYQGEALQTLVSLICSPAKSDRKLTIIATMNIDLQSLFNDLTSLFSQKHILPMIKDINAPSNGNLFVGIKTIVESLERTDGNVPERLRQIFML